MGATKRTAHSRSEAQAAAKQLLESAEYVKSLKDRILRGELMPQVETMLWHYAYGKPPDVIQLEGGTLLEQLDSLDDASLVDRARAAVERLEQRAKSPTAAGVEFFDLPPVGSVS